MQFLALSKRYKVDQISTYTIPNSRRYKQIIYQILSFFLPSLILNPCVALCSKHTSYKTYFTQNFSFTCDKIQVILSQFLTGHRRLNTFKGIEDDGNCSKSRKSVDIQNLRIQLGQEACVFHLQISCDSFRFHFHTY